ncbi:trypsin-like serine peptidase [Demetria terragena]|uniref:trypsin-like serine peptidase n=1 Tax=Demetria terragena TaxID=63959 RepID=UPI000377F4DF|nr:hypothetical protein [Demetria terragena]
MAVSFGAAATAVVAAASLGGVSASAAGEASKMQEGVIGAPLESAQQGRSGSGAKWTAAQLRSAIPVKRTVSAAQHKKVQATKLDLGAGLTVPSTSASSSVKRSAAEQACSLPATNASGLYQGCEQYAHYKQQGKMFYIDPRKPANANRYQCSATAVTAGNKSTVLTAGHCMHQGSGGIKGGFFKNVVFIPAYKDGAAPYGQWNGVWGGTTIAWANSSTLAGDVAFFAVAKNGGKTLGDTVGSAGVGFGATHQGSQTYAFGYPAAKPFDGSDSYYCSGKSFAGAYVGTKGLNCRLNQGASGGGWMVGLNVATGAGTAISVNSHLVNIYPGRMFGPHFGQAAKEAYDLVKGYAVS